MTVTARLSRRRRTALGSAGIGTTATAGCGFGGASDEIGVGPGNQAETTPRLSITVSSERSALAGETVGLSPGGSTGTTFENPGTTGTARVEADLGTSENGRVGARRPGEGLQSPASRRPSALDATSEWREERVARPKITRAPGCDR